MFTRCTGQQSYKIDMYMSYRKERQNCLLYMTENDIKASRNSETIFHTFRNTFQ